jgi:hypothetical protein
MVTPEVYPLNTAFPDDQDEPIYTRKTIRKVASIGTWTKLNGSLITNTTYIDNTVDLSPNASNYGRNVYAYRIKAVDNLDMESGPSPYWITIPQPVKHLNWNENWSPTQGIINLEWTPSPEENIQGYRIWFLDKNSNMTELTTTPITQNAYQHVVPGSESTDRDINFFVTAVDVLGQDGIPSARAAVNRLGKSIWDQYGYLNDYYTLSGVPLPPVAPTGLHIKHTVP